MLVVVLASGDELASVAGGDDGDGEDGEGFADDGAGAWEVGLLVEGVFGAHDLLVVGAVDGDLLDESVEVSG